MNTSSHRWRHSRRGRAVTVGLLLVVALLLTATVFLPSLLAQAGEYGLTWWTVDGGGGHSTGGSYGLDGTIGQPDAGDLAGDQYTVHGGFWQAETVGTATPTPPVVRTATASATSTHTSATASATASHTTPTAGTPGSHPTATPTSSAPAFDVFLPILADGAQLGR
jgi:hypothetical protein